MPADRLSVLPVGSGGINLRDSARDLHSGELVDSLNWRIDKDGSLVKRLGIAPFAVIAPAAILTLMVLRHSSGVNYYLAHCADGKVYYSTTGASWSASIDTGLTTTGVLAWFQYLDVIYWCDGSASFRTWDGTTLTTDADMPKGKYAEVWRNRAFISGVGSQPRRVYWSKIGDPTDFTTYVNDYVDFPGGSKITGLKAIQNSPITPDASDGVLVFTETRTHRIYDDSDNTGAVTSGGSNTLIDPAVGCMAGATLATLRGRVYCLGRDGVYSTDGHGSMRPESDLVSNLFKGMSWGSVTNFRGIAFGPRYYLAYTPVGGGTNSRVLELALDLPAREGQHPWMAHSFGVTDWINVQTATGETVYLADASSGDTRYVRQMFSGGYDVDGASTQGLITAIARTGAELLGIDVVKRIRRVEMIGRGSVTVTISADLESGAGEANTFLMASTGSVWGDGVWDVTRVWGGSGGAVRKVSYYTKRGRYMTFEIAESSANVGTFPTVLGYSGGQTGGAEVDSMVIKLTPLDAD